MATTDVTLTKIITAANYALLQEGVNDLSPYMAEIPNPNWVYDEASPDITEAPLITNPITNEEHVINWISKSYIEPIVKKVFNKNIAAIEKAARDSTIL
jgi:hypothetical protein